MYFNLFCALLRASRNMCRLSICWLGIDMFFNQLFPEGSLDESQKRSPLERKQKVGWKWWNYKESYVYNEH